MCMYQQTHDSSTLNGLSSLNILLQYMDSSENDWLKQLEEKSEDLTEEEPKKVIPTPVKGNSYIFVEKCCFSFCLSNNSLNILINI